MIAIKKIKWLGYLIVLGCFYYLAKVVKNLDISYYELGNPLQATMLIILFSIIFSMVVCTNSYAWKLVLEFIQGEKLNLQDTLTVYVKANIAKYLPGNVMHFAGRNMIGNKLGWKHSDIILGSVLEIVFLIVTALTLAIVFSFKEFIQVASSIINKIDIQNLLILILLGMILLSIGVYFVFSKKMFYEKLKLIKTKKFLVLFTKVFLINSLVFFIIGFMYVLISKFIVNIEIENTAQLTIISAYILAWVTGFVTPGAPGGIGVKESVLILLLSPVYGTENILLASFIHRLVSIMGDALAFGLGLIIREYHVKNSKGECHLE